MSRSDSPQVPPGGWPAQRPQAEPDPSAWTQGLAGAPRPNPKPQAQPHPQAPYAAPQGYPPQPAYGGQQAPPAAGFGHQDQGYYWGNDRQAAAAQAPRAPQKPFDPYVPSTTPSRRPAQMGYAAPAPQAAGPGYGQAPGYAPQPSSYAQAPAPGYGHEPHQPDLRGSQYDQWAAAPAPAPADPRGYDLSSYMPPQARTAPATGQDYGPLSTDPGAGQGYSDWGHQSPGYGQADQGYAQADPGYDHAQPGYDQSYAEPGAQAQAEYDEDQGYEYEEPPRRSKLTLIAAALVGAIVVGGGLTYAYQALLGPEGGGPTPLVRSAEGPAKVKPSEPGGKQFAHSDSKLLGRLNDGGSDADAAGSRKVSTLVVGRDGSIQAPPPPAASPPPGLSVPVPGMTLIDVTGPGAVPAAAPAAAAPIVVQPPPLRRVEVAAADPSPPVSTQAIATQAIAPQAVAPKTLNTAAEAPAEPAEERPKPVLKTAAIPPAAPSPAKAVVTPQPSSLGYVAVLASVPASGSSRIDALQQFADLQQKYGGILQNKTPDVQEANLGEKGRYHRLVVGPPGSKDGASSVCAQLKTAGYTSCWVMAY